MKLISNIKQDMPGFMHDIKVLRMVWRQFGFVTFWKCLKAFLVQEYEWQKILSMCQSLRKTKRNKKIIAHRTAYIISNKNPATGKQ